MKKGQFDHNGRTNDFALVRLVRAFISRFVGNKHFEFIVTPGGFLNFDFPKHLQSGCSLETLEEQIAELQKSANSKLEKFFKSLGAPDMDKLCKIGDFVSIGVDGSDSNNQRVELVAIYCLRRRKVIRWTGKFYPTEEQKRTLIKFHDLNSHFVVLNGQRVVVLGCHDLNVFSPRGQASVTDESYKGKVSSEFRRLFKKFKPEIVLQHPHNTDSIRIWNMSWNEINSEFPTVLNYASGIKYHNNRGRVRDSLEKVLTWTKKGDVVDFGF